MKLNDKFLAHDDGSEKYLVSTGESGFSGLVKGNKTAGFIMGCLECETTEAEIVAKMLKKYDVSEEIAKRDVHKIVAKLRSIGAIDE